MKILIVWISILLTVQEALTPGHITGGMKRMEEMIVNWQKSGVHVTVITTQIGEIFLKRESIDCEVVLLKEPPFFQSLISNRFGVSIVYLLRTILSLSNLKTITKGNFDAICATSHYFPDTFVLFILSIFSRGKAYFVHLYHVFPLPFEGARYQPLLISIFNWVQQIFGFALIRDFVIFTFQSQQGFLQGYGFKKSNILPVGMGLDLEEIRLSSPLNAKYDAIFLGRLTRKKGVFDLLRAWEEVVKILPQSTLCLVGQLSSEPVEETTERLGLTNNVTFFGVASGTRKYGLLKTADIFVFPSFEEGWGVVVSEALACGLPAIVYNLPAYEIFGEAVIKVSIGNFKQFAEQVIILLSNKEKRLLMKTNAMNEASSLDWKYEAERESR